MFIYDSNLHLQDHRPQSGGTLDGTVVLFMVLLDNQGSVERSVPAADIMRLRM